VDTVARPEPRGTSEQVLRLWCPVCRAIDWRRDGFSIAEDPTRRFIGRRRVAPAGDVDFVAWACHSCGYELSSATQLAGYLLMLQLTHIE
jgi:hypothetical protein